MSSTKASSGCNPCSSSTPGLQEVSVERSDEAPSGLPIVARFDTVRKEKQMNREQKWKIQSNAVGEQTTGMLSVGNQCRHRGFEIHR